MTTQHSVCFFKYFEIDIICIMFGITLLKASVLTEWSDGRRLGGIMISYLHLNKNYSNFDIVS